MVAGRVVVATGVVLAAACGSSVAIPTNPAPIPNAESCAALGSITTGAGLAILSGGICSPENSAVVRVNVRSASGGSAGICSGTVVAPRAVLTAAHCLDEDVAVARIWLGSGEEIVASSFHGYPGYTFNAPNVFDVGVLLFSADIPRTPMRILTSREARVDETAVLAGWGRDENDVTTNLRAGSTTISAVNANFLQTRYAPPSASVCSGDSGGPILLQENGTWAVGGITSATSASACNTGANFYQAVFNSNVRSFILQHVPNVGQR